MPKKKANKRPRGPKPERLKIDDDWKAAVKKSFSKKKPQPEKPKKK